jgi:hypothetical protein
MNTWYFNGKNEEIVSAFCNQSYGKGVWIYKVPPLLDHNTGTGRKVNCGGTQK